MAPSEYFEYYIKHQDSGRVIAFHYSLVHSLVNEIATEIEKTTKNKQTFELFDFIFKKMQRAAVVGYYFATLLSLEIMSETFRKRH